MKLNGAVTGGTHASMAEEAAKFSGVQGRPAGVSAAQRSTRGPSSVGLNATASIVALPEPYHTVTFGASALLL